VAAILEWEQPLERQIELVRQRAMRLLVDMNTKIGASPLGGRSAPHLPMPQLPGEQSPLDAFLRGDTGRARDLKRSIADWHVEGRMQLDAWLGDGLSLVDSEQQRLAQRALDKVEAVLRRAPGSPPPGVPPPSA
jgi:hypothetical protein